MEQARRIRPGRSVENQRLRDWLAANEDFRRYVLDRLRAAGPLPGDAIEDRATMSWTSTGWTNGLPVLAGERLIGWIVPRTDRRRGELVVESVFAEEGSAGQMADPSVAAAIESLASFAGATSVRYSGLAASAYPEHG